LFLFNSAALLIIRGAALVLVGSFRLILDVAVLVLLLGHVGGIHGRGQDHCDQTGKEPEQLTGSFVHFLRGTDQLRLKSDGSQFLI